MLLGRAAAGPKRHRLKKIGESSGSAATSRTPEVEVPHQEATTSSPPAGEHREELEPEATATSPARGVKRNLPFDACPWKDT